MRVPLVAAALSLIAVLVWVALSARDDEGLARGAGRAVPATTRVVTTDVPLLASPTLHDGARNEDVEPVRSPLSAMQLERVESRVVVVGRVVDDTGAPFPDVEVRLAGHQGWSEDFDAPRLTGRVDWRGFQVHTLRDGTFHIEAPVPSVDVTMLALNPGPFHDNYWVHFGGDQPRSLPALEVGTRDVGELRLVTTGAVSGRVIDARGRPIADAHIALGRSRSNTLGRETWTRADGTFLLGHAPVGKFGVNAQADGFLSRFVDGIAVHAGRESSGVDIVLEESPTIEGIVVDEHGAPLAGAVIQGRPAGVMGGGSARTTSEADGRFVMPLSHDEPYTLGVRLAGFDPWGNEPDDSTSFQPGSRQLRVVLCATPRIEFHVIDAYSGAPIERFGLEILPNSGSESPIFEWMERRPPPLADHPGGWAVLPARPGVDLYVAAADGYLLAARDVTPDVSVQTVRLHRVVKLVGRVMRDGEPLGGALVTVNRAAHVQWKYDGIPEATGGLYVTPVPAGSTHTTVDGRFEIDGLSRGSLRVSVRHTEGPPLILMPVELRAGGVEDIGDLHMLAGATILGEVLLPPNVQPRGLEVSITDSDGTVRAPLDSAGRFRFDDLHAAMHTVSLTEQPGLVAAGASMAVELVPGESRPVTIDARGFGMTEVVLTVLVDGNPVEHTLVWLSPADGGAGSSSIFGYCDSTGYVRGFMQAFGAVSVSISVPGQDRTPTSLLLMFHDYRTHPEQLELLPGERVEATLRF